MKIYVATYEALFVETSGILNYEEAQMLKCAFPDFREAYNWASNEEKRRDEAYQNLLRYVNGEFTFVDSDFHVSEIPFREMNPDNIK